MYFWYLFSAEIAYLAIRWQSRQTLLKAKSWQTYPPQIWGAQAWGKAAESGQAWGKAAEDSQAWGKAADSGQAWGKAADEADEAWVQAVRILKTWKTPWINI